MRYMFETPVRGAIGSEKFRTAVHWRNSVLITDEPEKLGGKDTGPDPFTLLLSSLVSTLATLRMYIDLKGLEFPEFEVEANMFHRIENNGAVLRIERKIDMKNLADPELQLKGNINIQTEFK